MSLALLTVVLLASLALAPEAMANFLTPKSGGSPNANEIDSLYKIVLYMAAVVFVIVEGALVYSVYKFRAKKGAVAAQIHGNTRLEIGWTVAAALILVVLTVVTFVKLPEHHQSAQFRSQRARAVGLGDGADAPQRQEARRLHPGPAVHLALHLRHRLSQQRLHATSWRTPTPRWSCPSTPRWSSRFSPPT